MQRLKSRFRISSLCVFICGIVQLVLSVCLLSGNLPNKEILSLIFLAASFLSLLSLPNKSPTISWVAFGFNVAVVVLLFFACLFIPGHAFRILFAYGAHWLFAGFLSSFFVLTSIAIYVRDRENIRTFFAKRKKNAWD